MVEVLTLLFHGDLFALLPALLSVFRAPQDVRYHRISQLYFVDP